MKKDIAILLPYFGKLPDYFSFFLQCCQRNPFIDFIIFTDDLSIYKWKPGGNIHVFEMDVKEFNQLASTRLELIFTLTKGYKLRDLRPAFGKIFEDYLKNYSFWGSCDSDIILGDLRKLITKEMLAAYDFISFYNDFISGPFFMVKNIPEANELFRKSKDYKTVFLESRNFYFDEAGGKDVIRQIREGTHITEAKSPVESFSHVVLNKEKCSLRLYFKHHITDRELCAGEGISWKDGKLYLNKEEILVYHYLWNKNKIHFNVPQYQPDENFLFSRNGFFYVGLKSRTIDWAISIISNTSEKALRMIQDISRS